MAETLRIEIPIETIDETAAGVNSAVQGFKKIDQACKNTGKSIKKANDTVTAFDKKAQKTEKSLAKWAKEKYEIYLEAKEKITPVLSVIKNGLKGFAGKTWGITLKAIDFVTAPIRGILNILRNPVFQAGAILGISIGLADTVNTYKDFEAAMSQVQAISSATNAELGNLTDKAKEMGATTKFTATESAEAFNYMAMAGWKTNDMMDGIEGVLNLAAASGEDLARTSDIVTDALTAFNMKASDAGHFSDVLAVAASNANTTVSGMGETFKYAGSMAGTFRYSIEDVALATGLMANAGIKGTMAGTALNAMFTRLASDTNGARSAIEDLGVEFFDAHGNAKDLSDVLDGLRLATAGMNDEQKSSIANTVAGMEAQKGLLAILNASEEDYKKLSEAVNNADGASKAMADTMLDNLAGSLTLLQSAVDGVKISAGERIAPYIRDFADWMTAQMPAVEAGIEEFMDWLDRKATMLQKKFGEIANTREWQDADFLEKVNIAWDEFIAEPFSEWWSSTGKAKFAGFAQDIGSGIGIGLKTGIMTLLGIDIGETLDEGASIGASFAKGFSEGFDFDMISGKLWQGFSNMLSSAGKLLPGGESADLSSLVSAVMLTKISRPVVKAGGGAFKIGKYLFGASEPGGTSIMSSLIGATGNEMVGGSGLLGKLADVGYSSTGAGSLSGGAAALVGAGSVAGAIAAGTTLISGGMDAHTALKSDDKEKSDAYGTSAALKMGGVAAGAALGAAIGSVVPVLGTAAGALIGAGLGGIDGWIKGDKVKSDYEANVEEMERMAEKIEAVYETTGVAVDKVSFSNAGLSRALKDTGTSAEEFASMFRESCADVMTDAFGEITLSLTEVKELAGKITFGKQAESLEMLSEASQKSSDALNALQSQGRALAKMNWKAGFGIELSADDLSDYQKTMDSFVSQAKTYLENRHYESAVAMKLLIGEDNTGSLDGSLNRMYEGLQTKIDILGGKLTARISVAAKDGIINIDERKEIENLQAQIEEITGKVSQAQENADFKSLQVKYGGSGLDAGSFTSLQEELAAKSQEMTANYDQALKLGITSLELQLSEGAIGQEEYDEMLAQLTDGYNAQIDALQVRVESFQLDTIAEAFGGELDGILPELGGTVSEKLTKVMNGALALRPDVSSWSNADIIKWFDLEGLDGELQANVSQLLKQTAEAIPDSAFREMGTGNGKAMVDSTKESILAEVPSLRSAAENAIATACATPFDVSTSINIRPNFSIDRAASSYLAGSSASSTASAYAASSGLTDGAGSPKLKGRSLSDTISKNAAGGYVSGGPQLSWLAEEGYGEFIIPTNPGRRSRALELYEQAGAALGVGYHADGGYVGSPISANIGQGYGWPDNAPESVPTGYNGSTEGGLGSTTIQVNVSMDPEFTISSDDAQSEEKIMSVIRRHMKEMADELGGEIAVKLEEVFSNMPLKEA